MNAYEFPSLVDVRSGVHKSFVHQTFVNLVKIETSARRLNCTLLKILVASPRFVVMGELT